MEILDIYKNFEVQASRNTIDTKRFDKKPKLMAPKTYKYRKILKNLKFSALLASLHARPDISPEAYSLKNFGFFVFFGICMVLAPSASDFFGVFGYLPGCGDTSLQKHCEYLKIPKNPKLTAPKPCKYPKIPKIPKFSALLPAPEAYSLKNFRIFGIFGYLHGFGTLSFGFFGFFWYLPGFGGTGL